MIIKRLKYNIALFLFFGLYAGHISELSAQTIYTSAQSGDWTAGSTWIGGIAPGAADNAIIKEGHTVRLTLGGAGSIINDLTIESGGVLDADNKEMNVSGKLLVNGIYTSFEGAAQDLNFSGDTLDGTGTIAVNKNTSYFIFTTSATILPSSHLNVFGHIRIDNAVTVTNQGYLEVSGEINGQNATTSVWTNDAGSTVKTGDLMMSTGILNASASGNTVIYAQQADQDVKTPTSSTYHNLIITGTGTKNIFTSLIIENDLTAADFTEGTGTVTFNSTTDQSITNTNGEVFYDLTINKSSGSLILNNNVNVSNTLTLTAGVIGANAGTIILGTSIANTGTLSYTGGIITGSFSRWINSTGTFLFSVGTSANYHPLNITLNGLGAGGTLTSKFNESVPGENGLPLFDNPDSVFNTFVDGYWELNKADGFNLGGGNNYNITLDGTGFTAFSIDGATRVLTRADAGSAWLPHGTHLSPVGNVARRNTMTMLSAQYAFGDTTNCSPPSTSAITGLNEVCTATSGVSYVVDNHPPSTYFWIITGGNLSSGQGASTITVDWGSTGMANANVRVIESNSCTDGAPVDLPVTIHSIQPSSISGKTSVAELTAGEPYSVSGISGYTYTWNITGGTLASGQGTSSITVDWGSYGTGIVSVVARKSGCAAAPAKEINVNKYIVIESIATGDWDDPATWDCNCIPLQTMPYDNVRIKNGHTVSLVAGGAGTEVKNFIIEAGGTLNPNNRIMTIHENFELYGTYGNGTKDLIMSGFGSYIDGVGILQQGIVLSANVYFRSTAVINITTGNIEIDNGIQVSNYGSVTIAGNITGGNATSKWTNEINSVLRVGGTLLTTGTLAASASGNTVNYNGTVAQTIKTPLSNYYNLTVNGSNNKNLASDIDINGNITISGTSSFVTNNFNINLAGDWNNTGGTFTEGTGTVIFDGFSNQTINGVETFYNLNFTNTSGLYLNNNVSVSNTLTMGGGNFYPQASKLIIGTGAVRPGTVSYTSGIVAGKLERWVNATGTGILYPIGTPGIYRPATITYNNLSSGSVIGEFIAADPGSAGLPLSEGTVNVTNQYTEGYWDFTAANGLTTSDFNIKLTATGFTSYTIIPGTRIIKRKAGGNWILDGIHAAASDPDLYRNNLSDSISTSGTQFGAGHVVCSGLSIDRIITDVSCYGESDGEIDITMTGGTAPYTYAWEHGPTTEDVSGLSGGSYSVNVTDANGCEVDSTFTVAEPTAIQIDKVITNVSCHGGNNGAIDITPSGGTPAYTFSWSHGPTTEDVGSLTAGTYTVTVTDANLCEQDSTFTVAEPTAIQIDKVITNVSCHGGNNGAIDITPSGGTSAYTFSWSHGPTTEDVGSLTAGTYTVTVTDANTCTRDSTFTVSEPAALVINKVITNVSIPGGNNGAIDITPGGGTPGYTYSWSHGPITEDVGGLSAGTYTVTVTDASACTLDSSFIVSELSGLVINRVITHVSCYSQNNGSIDITVIGGTPGYTYAWSHGPSTEDVNGLQSGNYTVTVTDDLGITVDSTFTITEPSALEINKVITDVGCYGGGDGAINITVIGGTPGYTYSWSHGPTTEDVSDLVANNYTVTVTDANGCIQDSTFIVNQPPVSEPPLSASSDRNNICPGDNNIILSYSGGILGGGAEAVWYSDSIFLNQIGTANNLMISSPITTTKYYVRFEGYCDTTSAISVTVYVNTLSIPPENAFNNRDSVCPGEGVVVLSYSGGSLGSGAEAVWYDDVNLTSVIGTGNNLSIPAPSIETTYFVRFEGDCNTTDFASTTIYVYSNPLSEFIEKTETLCTYSEPVLYIASGFDGSAFNWSIEGGTIIIDMGDSVVVDWEDTPGNYVLTVVESTNNGCVSEPVSVNIQVTEPVVDLGTDQYICDGTSVFVTPIGDFVNHLWHDGTSTSIYQSFETEIVRITVFDENGCSSKDSIQVTKVPNPYVDLGNDTSLCGIKYVILNAGNEGSTYLWSTGETTREITVTQGGQVIWVRVTNEYGCDNNDTINIFICSVDDYFKKIPNTFTPNGDNVNETWYFGETGAFPEMIIEIFDRWGKLVYRSERGYPEPWDGKAPNGKDLPVDSYYYVIKLNDGSDPLTGIVTIIR